MWTMYDQKVPNAWCPHCGFNADITSNVEPTKDDTIIKTKEETVNDAEDRITESRCSDGGWWNPLKKECMGSGLGYKISQQ